MPVRCAVLGDPIGHSLSPVIHRAAYDALGLDWQYDAVRVPAGGLAAFLDGLDESWRGLSLTMPLKREVLPLLDSKDAWVHATGACNTVVLEPDGQRHGLNTDVTGALMVLGETEPLERAAVLGGGATAASMLLALTEHGTRAVTLVVRDPARAEETLRVVAAHERPPTVEVRTVEEFAASSLVADVVWATIPAAWAVGWQPPTARSSMPSRRCAQAPMTTCPSLSNARRCC